jgi:1-phosphatidylinositol-4-phosphate 5-kinase
MLKTCSHNEFEHFKKIMKNYYYHLLAFPHTLIARFFGLHKISFNEDGKIKRIYFVVMANVFNTQREIHVRYDLKGSTYGRFTKVKEGEAIPSGVALKDVDWLNSKEQINLKPEVRALLLQQLKHDAEFFKRNNINDYSVLLGVHNLKDAREGRKIIRKCMNVEDLLPDGIIN